MNDVKTASICSSSRVVRLSLRAVLNEQGVRICAEFSGAAEIGNDPTGVDHPDVVVVFPDRGNSLGDLSTIPPTVMVLHDEMESGPTCLKAMRRGVRGIVSADSDLDALVQACRLTVAGSGYLSPAIVRIVVALLSGASREVHRSFGLTAREAQVLRLLAIGHTVPDIAGGLRISPRAVKHNLGNVYRKLRTSGATGAVVRAYQEGLIG